MTAKIIVERVMKPTDYGRDPADHGVLAHDGATVHRLTLHVPSEEERPVLVNAAGVVFNPWELQLRWPPPIRNPPCGAVVVICRVGLLRVLELWCNCAD